MTFCRGLQKLPETDFRLVDLPPQPQYLIGWFIFPSTTQPGRLVFTVDNRVADGGYGTRDVGFYMDLSVSNFASSGVPLYPFDPVRPSVTIPAGELKSFELDSYLPGQKLDLLHAVGFYVTVEAIGGAAKTKMAVLCGAPLSRLEWFGIIV